MTRLPHRHLTEAGLDAFVDIRLGDAMATLKDVEAPIDLVLLDGWKDLYIPLIKMLAPKLRRGSVVFADNIHIFKNTLRPYVDYVRDRRNGSAGQRRGDAARRSPFRRNALNRGAPWPLDRHAVSPKGHMPNTRR